MKNFISEFQLDRFKKLITFYSKRVKHTKINKYQFISCLLLALALMGALIYEFGKQKESVQHFVNFERAPKAVANKFRTIHQVDEAGARKIAHLQAQLNKMKEELSAYFQAMNAKLQNVRSNMDRLASQQDVKQLQQQLARPNQVLLGKVNSIQGWVQRILQQASEKHWVGPQAVQHYFQLAAVQGFSDGMRAIIDIDGNQTALSVNETCPACCGWTLKSMDFSNQTAIFYKEKNNVLFLVKLDAN